MSCAKGLYQELVSHFLFVRMRELDAGYVHIIAEG